MRSFQNSTSFDGCESGTGVSSRSLLCPFQHSNYKTRAGRRTKIPMSQQIQLTKRIPSASTSISLSFLRCRFVFVALTCAPAWLALSPPARAVYLPPDGGYPDLNTAEGDRALFSLTTGLANTAIGYQALFSNTTGGFNTANGGTALYHNTTGSNNIALGDSAGLNLTTGSNNIDIGHFGHAGESNTIRIGTSGTQTQTFIAGISGAAISGTIVVVNGNGKLGVATSSERFKETIKRMDKASRAIHALKPVTFYYKKELDPDGVPQFGLVAEEVEKVNPALITRDADGKPYTVRYEAVNAMLLNEFLKEHRKVQELEATVAQQQKGMEVLAAQLKEQAAQIQKVSAQLEVSKPAPQIVVNDR